MGKNCPRTEDVISKGLEMIESLPYQPDKYIGLMEALQGAGRFFNPQGVQSRRNVHESHRFMKNHEQIYVPKCPRTYEKHPLNLLKLSIPDISTRTLTIFSVETLSKLYQTM